MANGNQKQQNGTTGEVVTQPVQETVPVQTEAQVVVVQQQPAEPEKQGFGAWCKRNWKKLAAGATALLAAGGSAVVAYKKGKAAGIMSVPVPQQQEQDDYSLNPNE